MIARIAAGFAVAGFAVAGLLKLENDHLHDQVTNLRGELATCGARMQNIIEARESDASIPDDLDGFIVPGHWLHETDATD